MGKSYRRKKIFGFTTASSEKRDKVLHHRKMRRRIHTQLSKSDDETPFPIDNEISNPCAWSKDGKQYWKQATKRDLGK